MAHDAPSAAPTRISADPTVRRLAGANFVSTLGNGLTMTLSALYFTQVVRIPVAHVGLALTVAGMFGVAASIQFGPIVDRLGSRRVMTLLLVGSAICSASLGLLHSFWPFLAVITATSVVSSGASTARATLYSHALPPEARTQARAFLRAVTNVGIGAGSALAAVALHLGTREAYVTAFLADALTFLA
ncbi:MAG: MFS transporter, partial [Actinobacteria bacterium]|nr:MFS transporter [Actinomycetota bacterium]